MWQNNNNNYNSNNNSNNIIYIHSIYIATPQLCKRHVVHISLWVSYTATKNQPPGKTGNFLLFGSDGYCILVYIGDALGIMVHTYILTYIVVSRQQ